MMNHCAGVVALLASLTATVTAGECPDTCRRNNLVSGEFYFDSRLPVNGQDCKDVAYDGNSACAVVGDISGTDPILDNGAAYSTGHELGKNYGWDCDGSLVFPVIAAHCIIDSSSTNLLNYLVLQMVLQYLYSRSKTVRW
jgi:hypothetical protein